MNLHRSAVSNQLQLLCPRPNRRGIKRWCCLTSDVCLMFVCLSVCLTSVCRLHHEYSWRPQLLEARRAGRRRRKACMGWSWAAACGVHGWGISCGLVHSLFRLISHITHGFVVSRVVCVGLEVSSFLCQSFCVLSFHCFPCNVHLLKYCRESNFEIYRFD